MIATCHAFRLRIRNHSEQSVMTIKDLTENKIIIRRAAASSDGIQSAIQELMRKGYEIQYHFDYNDDIYLIAP